MFDVILDIYEPQCDRWQKKIQLPAIPRVGEAIELSNSSGNLSGHMATVKQVTHWINTGEIVISCTMWYPADGDLLAPFPFNEREWICISA